MGGCKFQRPLGACKNRGEHLQWRFRSLSRTGLCSRMNHKGESTLGELKISDITGQQLHVRVGSKVWRLGDEVSGASRQHSRVCIQREFPVDMAEALY